MLRFELMEELKNVVLVVLSTAPTHQFDLGKIQVMLESIGSESPAQQIIVFPILGWVVVFFFSRTLGVLLKEWWDIKIKGKFDKWRKSRNE